MVVPQGGSNCAKCEYLSETGAECSQPQFNKWNGGPTLPAPPDVYCCDFFEAKDEQSQAPMQQEQQPAEPQADPNMIDLSKVKWDKSTDERKAELTEKLTNAAMQDPRLSPAMRSKFLEQS
jgi:hypothetical protein